MAILSTAKIVGAVSCAKRTGRRIRNAAGQIMFEVLEEFISGFAGKGWKIWERIPGKWKMELDELAVRGSFTVFELLAHKVRALVGALGITQACGKIKTARLDQTGDNWLITLEEPDMNFMAHDFIRAQVRQGGTFKGYWVEIAEVREVDGVQTIVVPITELEGSIGMVDGMESVIPSPHVMNTPAAGDDIVQFGNSQNPARQSAIYLHADEGGQPAIDILFGIRSRSFAGCLKQRIGGDIPGTDGLKGFYCENGMLKGVDETGNVCYCIHPNGTAEFGGGSARFAADRSGFIAGGAVQWRWDKERQRFRIDLTDEAIDVLANRINLSGLLALGALNVDAQRRVLGLNDATAQALGYDSAEQMLQALDAHQTLIHNGKIRTELIDAALLITQHFRAGANPQAPQGFNALIDPQGNGHLSGGKMWFRDGEAGIGPFEIGNDELTMRDGTGEVRLQYSSRAVEALQDVAERGVFSGELNRISGVGQATFSKDGPANNGMYPYSAEGIVSLDDKSFHISRNGSTLSMDVRMDDPFYGNSVDDYTTGLSFVVNLYRGSTYVGYKLFQYEEGQPWYGGSVRFDNLDKGTYHLRVGYRISAIKPWNPEIGTMPDEFHQSLVVEMTNIRWSVDTQNYRKIAYFSDGMYTSYPDSLLYQSEEEGTVVKGKSDLPGVLCAARVDANRTATYHWGKYAAEQGTVTPGIERDQNGVYKVSHTIGHTNYVPTVTPNGGGALMVEMLDTYPSYFTFKMYNRGGSVASSAFNYQCIGSNG